MIFTVSLYFGVSKPAKNLGIFKVLGGFEVSKPEKTLVFHEFGSFWGPKHVENLSISWVAAQPAGQPAGEKREK